ncbi:hypothetical protein UMM65_10715 [Aureibaculum sp. 2210JD6-5]|uniref:hypothetical protein n=1 Tax=Aureibaculum sp. 2210JD6-5 TaxID=3103957 RepID=UPI002AAE23D8|nr:hypothetical protein [Aureibaculum sp. 2210JD6-5]MDY7395716.1 hypothetical protein [Aureibaculum sp. 2210JD6-5]
MGLSSKEIRESLALGMAFPPLPPVCNWWSHHPLAKIAFDGDTFYDLQKVFSVGINSLENAWKTIHSGTPQFLHAKITGQQNSLYSAFAKTGDRLTLEKMAEIEIKAMVNSGIPEDVAAADDLWESFQDKFETFVDQNGGNALAPTPKKYRPDWTKAQDVLEGKKPISDLGCN